MWGTSFAATALAKFHLSSSHGFAPDKYFAELYIRRAEQLGASRKTVEALKTQAASVQGKFSTDAILQRLQGVWHERNGGTITTTYTIEGLKIRRSCLGVGASTYQFTLDWGTCPHASEPQQRLQFRGQCYLLEWKSPNELVTDSEANKVFSSSPTKLTWKRSGAR